MEIILLFIDKEFSAFLGWTGTVSYLLAYLLLCLNKLRADQKLYHVLNIVGALGLTCNALSFHDYPNVIVNIVWAIIALMAIFFIWRKKQN